MVTAQADLYCVCACMVVVVAWRGGGLVLFDKGIKEASLLYVLQIVQRELMAGPTARRSIPRNFNISLPEQTHEFVNSSNLVCLWEASSLLSQNPYSFHNSVLLFAD